MRRASKDVLRGLTPEAWEGAAWSSTQCRTALLSIAYSPHGAVRVSQLAAQVGAGVSLWGLKLWDGGGRKALESMHEQNLLLRRSFEDDTRDVDPAAFGFL